MTDVAQRLWGFCHTLRHEGVDYGDYIEQITYLLFLKMAEEKAIDLPAKCEWDGLRQASGTELTDNYIEVLRTLGKQPGLLGDIFSGAQSRFSNPVSLKKLIGLIDDTHWTELGVDVKAAAFEGLLEKAASEGKKGAGQYFTPRLLIDAIVRCVKPDPRKSRDFKICDPACGTGGFLVSSYEWLMAETQGGGLDRTTAKRVVRDTYHGQDLVARPRRLALMNLYLHQLEPQITLGDSVYDPPGGERYDVILTNPPFGIKGANQAPARDDFTISTSNKQLNFLQHVLTILKPGGRAAVVVPDSCLFADAAGAVFRVLTEDCDVHTILRLPNGTFSPYSPGTKTNVLFFTKGFPTEKVWIYDARTRVSSITKKARPLGVEHFLGFEACYGADPLGKSPRSQADSGDDRWRPFDITDIQELNFNIDRLRWLRPAPGDADGTSLDELLADAVTRMEATTAMVDELLATVEEGSNGEGPDEDQLPPAWGELALEEGVVHMLGGAWGKDPATKEPDWVDARVVRGTEFRHWDDQKGATAAIRSLKPSHAERRMLATGDLIVEVSGGSPNQPVGRCLLVDQGVLDQFDVPVICSNFCRQLRLHPDLRPAFVQAYLRHLYALGELDRFQPQTVNIRNLNVPDFVAEVRIPVPPLPEQDRIVAQLADLLGQTRRLRSEVESIAALDGSAISTKLLERALVAQAVRGRLVPAEADLAAGDGRSFESGEELAARIRSEVAARTAS